MLKNFSSIALVGAMIFSTTGCILVTSDDNATSLSASTTASTTDNTTETAGDGDGDPTGDGDGDGDTATGDGDGDPASGDGDGDATGDGDGDATGDGDGDTPIGMCGWDAAQNFYGCGFEGEDPGGTFPLGCPDGLVEGNPCEDTGLTGEGCCDAEGNNWYCTQAQVAFVEVCE